MRRKVTPGKEFELLYRERNPLPSSTDAYESIIFMKTKKGAPKHTVRQLQQVFSALQHRIAPAPPSALALPLAKPARPTHLSPPHACKLPSSNRYHKSIPSLRSPTSKTGLSKSGREGETSRGKGKAKGRKLGRRKNEDAEYVLLDGGFVRVRTEEVNLLEERLLTSRAGGKEGGCEGKGRSVKEVAKKDSEYGDAEEIDVEDEPLEARNSWEEEF
jgi:hypothetical protein